MSSSTMLDVKPAEAQSPQVDSSVPASERVENIRSATPLEELDDNANDETLAFESEQLHLVIQEIVNALEHGDKQGEGQEEENDDVDVEGENSAIPMEDIAFVIAMMAVAELTATGKLGERRFRLPSRCGHDHCRKESSRQHALTDQREGHVQNRYFVNNGDSLVNRENPTAHANED